ncbi:hypothetical protein [Rhodococcus sp. OK302]|uniref:hypothetical protein n=1 Tax=Rhodococcus sp. OK302 TaxID=1882769 RepID=UPI000B944CD0|nr:hypothetical protein [Rhodococcus sp. OK302]
MKKTITGIIGAFSLLALVACGSDGGEPTSIATVTSSAAAEQSATPGTPAPAEDSANYGGGAAISRNYTQTCADVLVFIDGYEKTLEESGDTSGTTRESVAAELQTSIEAYPAWTQMSADEQAEVTRGISAAAAGSC